MKQKIYKKKTLFDIHFRQVMILITFLLNRLVLVSIQLVRYVCQL